MMIIPLLNQFGRTIEQAIIVNELAISHNVHGRKEETVFGNLNSSD